MRPCVVPMLVIWPDRCPRTSLSLTWSLVSGGGQHQRLSLYQYLTPLQSKLLDSKHTSLAFLFLNVQGCRVKAESKLYNARLNPGVIFQ